MRAKEFLIFIFIFTIIYILFWIIFDRIVEVKRKNTELKKAKSLINIDNYKKFSEFYGYQSKVSKETIMMIFNDLKKNQNNYITELSKKYLVNNYEVVTIILYLEYLNLIFKKKISLENNIITNLSYIEQNLIQKYLPSFNNKDSLEVIRNNLGQNSINDINIIIRYNLIPGLRLIDNKLYYIGEG